MYTYYKENKTWYDSNDKVISDDQVKNIIKDVQNNKFIIIRQPYQIVTDQRNNKTLEYFRYMYIPLECLNFILNDNTIFLSKEDKTTLEVRFVKYKDLLNKCIFPKLEENQNLTRTINKIASIIYYVDDNSYLDYNKHDSNYEKKCYLASKKKYDKLTDAQKILYYTLGGKYNF